jgi:hypothetical protein
VQNVTIVIVNKLNLKNNVMKHFLVFNLVFAFIFISCVEDKNISPNDLQKDPQASLIQPGHIDQPSTQEEAEERLSELFSAIVALAESKECVDGQEWSYTAYGAKVCGGPIGYIAYSQQIDTEKFIEKVKEYTKAQEDFNQKWFAISDCMIPNKPSGVECVEGKPRFIY